jgi:hypothetical protein
MAKPLPDVELLKQRYNYNPITGVVTGRRNGKVLRWTDSHGYLKVRVNKEAFKLARIIWKIVTGKDPVGEVDHIDLNRRNNRWTNLRDATSAQNNRNRKPKTNKGKLKGANWHKRTGRYESSICVNGKRIYLGSFATAAEANAKYRAAAIEHFGSFARG